MYVSIYRTRVSNSCFPNISLSISPLQLLLLPPPSFLLPHPPLSYDLFNRCDLDKDVFVKYMSALQSQYIATNAYHNALHAADVTQVHIPVCTSMAALGIFTIAKRVLRHRGPFVFHHSLSHLSLSHLSHHLCTTPPPYTSIRLSHHRSHHGSTPAPHPCPCPYPYPCPYP